MMDRPVQVERPTGSRAEIEAELPATRGRREEVARDLALRRTQAQDLAARVGQEVAKLEPDPRALKEIRKERAAALAAIDELEPALAQLDARIGTLEADFAQAIRRDKAAIALALIDREDAEAQAVDRTFDPFLRALQTFTLTHRDCAAQLQSIARAGRNYRLDDATLARVMLWRLAGFVELTGLAGFLSEHDRVTVAAFVARRRQQVRAELAAIATVAETTGGDTT